MKGIMRFTQQQRQPQENPYDVVRRIMSEGYNLNWAANQPEELQTTSIQTTDSISQPDNPDIQYIGKLVGEIKSKLDSIFTLSANTNEWTRETVSTLIEVDNTLSSKVQSLNYVANMNSVQHGVGVLAIN